MSSNGHSVTTHVLLLSDTSCADRSKRMQSIQYGYFLGRSVLKAELKYLLFLHVCFKTCDPSPLALSLTSRGLDKPPGMAFGVRLERRRINAERRRRIL